MRALNPRSGWELKQGGGAGVAVGLNSTGTLSAIMVSMQGCLANKHRLPCRSLALGSENSSSRHLCDYK